MTSYTPQPPPQPVPASDRTTLFGVIGIVGAICCVPVGIVFGILALMEARKVGKPPTLGYVALGLSVLALIIGIISVIARN